MFIKSTDRKLEGVESDGEWHEQDDKADWILLAELSEMIKSFDWKMNVCEVPVPKKSIK